MRRVEVQCEYDVTHVVDVEDEDARKILRQLKVASDVRGIPSGVLRLDDAPGADFREQIRIPFHRVVSITVTPPLSEENDDDTSTSDR